MFKRMGAFLCALTLLWCCLTCTGAAAVIDTARQGTLTIEYGESGSPLSGAPFELFYVAEVSSDGVYTLCGDFAGYPVSIDRLDADGLHALASTLNVLARQDALTPMAHGVTGEEGRLSFSGLKCGMYLLLGTAYSQDGYLYTPQPTIVLLPAREGQNGYDVTAAPKPGREDVPGQPQVVTRKVLKVWQDGKTDAQRPETLTVHLLRDGKVYDTVTLTARGGWHHTWQGLDASKVWTVTEAVPEGYTMTVVQEGITFLLTNTASDPGAPDLPDEPDEPKLPQTGQLWWPVYLLAGAGMALFLAGFLRNRGERRA